MKGKGATRQTQKPSLLARLDMRLLKAASIGVTVVSIMVAVVLLLLQTANKPVNQLVLTNKLEHITYGMVEAEIAPWFPEGYIYIDINAIKDQLQKMVMVSQINVEKVWPNTLNISIEEERPVATWNGKSMLSEKGDILPLALEELELPKLKGADSESKLVMQHFLLFSRWGKRHQLNLVGLQHSSAGWKLEYNAGFQIWLDNNKAMKNLQQLEHVINQFQISQIRRIDMRYEQGFAVDWKQTSDQAQG